MTESFQITPEMIEAAVYEAGKWDFDNKTNYLTPITNSLIDSNTQLGQLFLRTIEALAPNHETMTDQELSQVSKTIFIHLGTALSIGLCLGIKASEIDQLNTFLGEPQ